jgi:hypothetical protein
MKSNPYTEEYFKSNNYTNYLSKKERYARTADEIYQTFNKFGILTKNSSSLDYGCSLGFLINGFEKLGISNVYGYDISDWAIEQAKKDNCKIISDLTGNFNLGIFLDVLEHMEDSEIESVFLKVQFDAILVRIPCSIETNPNEFHLEVSRADETHINCKTANQWIYFFKRLGYSKNLYLNMSTIYNSDGCLCCLFI